MIEIRNYRHNQDYAPFSLSIDESKKNLILFDVDRKISDKVQSEFGKRLAGINASNSIYFYNELVFDNENYFQSRIYLDDKYQYYKTLNEEIIAKTLLAQSKKAMNKDKFKEITHDLKIYSHKNKTKIDAKGKSLFCFALGLSSYANVIFNLYKTNVQELIQAAPFIQKSSYGMTIIIENNENVYAPQILEAFDNIIIITKHYLRQLNIQNTIVWDIVNPSQAMENYIENNLLIRYQNHILTLPFQMNNELDNKTKIRKDTIQNVLINIEKETSYDKL